MVRATGKFEFDYALLKKGVGQMIAVVMEKRCRDPRSWPGVVGGKLGPLLYVDLAEDGPDFEGTPPQVGATRICHPPPHPGRLWDPTLAYYGTPLTAPSMLW